MQTPKEIDYNYVGNERLCAVIDFSMGLFELRHGCIRDHSVRVADLARHAAAEAGLVDPRTAYIAGLLHDIGKLALPDTYFTGGDLDAAGYADVKQHVHYGYHALKDEFLFTALCCGFHHAVQRDGGYGLGLDELPAVLSPDTRATILLVATLVAICDFADAAATRATTLQGAAGASLQQTLLARYPDHPDLVSAVLCRQAGGAPVGSWVDRARGLAAAGRSEQAAELVMATCERLLQAGDLDALDRLFAELDPATDQPDLLFALLAATLGIRDELRSRQAFHGAVARLHAGPDGGAAFLQVLA